MRNHAVDQLIADYVIAHQQDYYRLAYSYVRNEQDALDIIQEAILKALASKNTLKEPEFIKTWFYRIIVNTALDHLRKHNRTTVNSELLEALPEESATDTATDFDLQQALDELPDQYRSIIVLRYFEDMKIEEVARVLGENANTIKTRLYAALKKLRIQLSA